MSDDLDFDPEELKRSMSVSLAVAPLDWDPAAAFAHLASIAERVRKAYPTAVHISAGMSDDLEAAVAAGSTHVRVGSALLGNRPTLG